MTMISTTHAIKKDNLEKRLAILTKDVTLAESQINITNNAVERRRLQEQADNIYQEIQKTEDELQQLENSEENLTKKQLNIEDDLPNIDFKEVVNIMKAVTKKIERDGLTAIFLLEKTYSYAGNYCILRIKKYLQNEPSRFYFKEYKVEISSVNAYELGFLESLDKYLKVDCEKKYDLKEYTKKVIKKLCDSLQHNHILFIEINKWNNFLTQKETLNWFLQEFWCYLIEESKMTIQSKKLRYVKIVAVIDSEYELKPECKKMPIYCKKNNFESTKIIKISLKKWTEQDIQLWLEKHTTLPDNQINEMTKQIYLKTEKGLPSLVCQALKTELSNERVM